MNKQTITQSADKIPMNALPEDRFAKLFPDQHRFWQSIEKSEKLHPIAAEIKQRLLCWQCPSSNWKRAPEHNQVLRNYCAIEHTITWPIDLEKSGTVTMDDHQNPRMDIHDCQAFIKAKEAALKNEAFETEREAATLYFFRRSLTGEQADFTSLGAIANDIKVDVATIRGILERIGLADPETGHPTEEAIETGAGKVDNVAYPNGKEVPVYLWSRDLITSMLTGGLPLPKREDKDKTKAPYEALAKPEPEESGAPTLGEVANLSINDMDPDDIPAIGEP